MKRQSVRGPKGNNSKGFRARSKNGDDAERFLVEFLALHQNNLHRAPWDVKWAAGYSGLKAPEGPDDFMTAVFRILATHLPESFLHPDVMELSDRDKRVVGRRGSLFVVLTHPLWNRIEMLKQLVNRLDDVRKVKPNDWKHWMCCIFELTTLLLRRILADVQQVATEQGFEVKFENAIATDDKMLQCATEAYRHSLREWKNENDRPPFTKHDVWMALLQDKDVMDGFLASPSILLEERALRVMENYRLSMREARVVVATMEQMGKTIDLSKDDEKAA